MTMRTDVPYHEDHLRRLLDQRTARADLHGRFPSVSEITDSPSIYSHAPFSPRPFERADTDASSSNYVMATHDRRPSEPRSPMSVMSDRQRLNIPHASSLDLDDDPRSSYAGSDAIDDDDASTQEGDSEDDGELHRVSAYGPKMIVHSRAPWETGEDDLEDEGEPDAPSRRSGFMFSKGESSKKSKGTSGRPIPDRRPSTESTRSQTKPKQSFDTVSSNVSAGGALLALAQASMSSTSLVLSQNSSPQTSLRDKLPLPRFRSRTPSNTNKAESSDSRPTRPNLTSPSPHSSPASHFRALSPTGAEFYRSDERPSYTGHSSSSPHTPQHQGYHPYANPELVHTFAREISPARRLEELHALASSSSLPPSPGAPYSESTVTLSESATSSTITTTQSRSDTTLSLTPGTSMSSVPTQNDLSPTARSFAKGISAPIPIDGIMHMSSQRTSDESGGQPSSTGSQREQSFPPIAGWADNAGSAPIKLISLQEAQAQARERSRSATVNGTPMTAPTISGPSRIVETRQAGQPSGGRSRMRTASASGARMKHLASSSTLDLRSTPDLSGDMSTPHKTIGRKKSGFMRLFNGKDKVQSPPPVPSISMDLVPPTPPVHSSSSRSRKQSSHRVPVPSLTPSMFVDADGNIGSSSSDSQGTVSSHSSPSNSATGPKPKQLSVRRNAPGLSILTHPPTDSLGRAVEHGLTPTTGATDMTFSSVVSASPDPRAIGFVGLSLRPVSTLFSSNFVSRADDGGSDGGRPSLESDSGTPNTNTTAISPRSPEFVLRSEPCVRVDKGESPSAATHEDQGSVIQALQDQILTARRAWQRQVWELEGQVRDLKAEVDDLRAGESAQDYCSSCGRGSIGRPTEEGTANIDDLRRAGVKVGGVVNRPRARTGVGTRFASAV